MNNIGEKQTYLILKHVGQQGKQTLAYVGQLSSDSENLEVELQKAREMGYGYIRLDSQEEIPHVLGLSITKPKS